MQQDFFPFKIELGYENLCQEKKSTHLSHSLGSYEKTARNENNRGVPGNAALYLVDGERRGVIRQRGKENKP